MTNLRSATVEDEWFLFEVYAETRREELQAAGLDEEVLDAFLRMQFDLQKRSYARQHPKADHQIVLCEGVPAGRFLTAETAESWHLIDVSLLPAYRQKGIGTRLIQELQQKAAASGKTVRLHVLQNNPAQRLYARLGFCMTGEQFPYVGMVWQPTGEKNVSIREESYNE